MQSHTQLSPTYEATPAVRSETSNALHRNYMYTISSLILNSEIASYLKTDVAAVLWNACDIWPFHTNNYRNKLLTSKKITTCVWLCFCVCLYLVYAVPVVYHACMGRVECNGVAMFVPPTGWTHLWPIPGSIRPQPDWGVHQSAGGGRLAGRRAGAETGVRTLSSVSFMSVWWVQLGVHCVNPLSVIEWSSTL